MIKEEQIFKTTLNKPMNKQSKAFEKNFDKTMTTNKIKLNEVDGLLTEKERSLKKKIFNLAKMEALVFSDPKLSAVYDEMSENGEEKYGYHYNETIMNMLFNDYVLNSPKYLQKYKQAIPKEKKRRDKSGINQLKQAGEEMQTRNLDSKPESTLEENDEEQTKVQFLVNEKDPKNPDLFAYFPEENFDNAGQYKTAYSHVGQHSSASPEYAAESRPATPEEYQDLKAELESLGYKLEVLNPANETTGAGSSGAFAPAMGYEKQVAETTTSASSGAYVGPSAWGSGDLMKTKGKSPIQRKPIWQGGTIIQESNYLIDSSDFEKYVDTLNESDVDFIQKNSEAYGSLDKMNGNDINIIKNDIKTGQPDKPNFNTMEEQIQNTGKITTVEELKAYAAEKKAQGVQGYMKEAIPMLAGAALYEVAIRTANKILGNKIGLGWDDLGDTNSMWDYIDQNGGMTYESFVEAVKNAANDRLDEEGFGGGDLDEVSKSKKQQRFMGMVHAVQKGELSPEKVGGDVEKAAETIKSKDVEDFASTKHKNLPEKVSEDGSWEAEQDLKQLQGDALNADKEALRHMGLVGRIVNESNSIDELLSGLGEYFTFKKINDSDLITSIVGKAVTMFKNKNNSIKEDTQTMIQNNGTSMSNKAIPAGEQSGNMDMGTRASGGMSETLDSANKLLEEVNNELNAFSIHQDKLKKMSEDRKPSALVLRDRLGSENETNFKKDLQHSGTKEIINVEKELQWKDQQTDVPKNPQELGEDIEDTEIKSTDAKSGEALKNVGDSANDKGDEIPKRNFTTKEQEEVDNYRLGQHSLVYDNEPGKRFEDRMKADMGDKMYDIREKQMKFRGKAPMYNKDPQPVEDTTSDKVQFNKEQSGWNERQGLKETMITGRFVDALGKKFIMDFRLNEVKELQTPSGTARQTGLFELDFTGFGNKYKSKTQDKKVIVNESIDSILSEGKYYTDGKEVFVIKNPVQKLNESEQKENKPVVNEQFDKMKHLLGYKPNDFVNTNNVKKNRGF